MGAMGGGLPSASSSARVGEYTWERYAGRGDGGRVVLNSDRRANPPKGLLARLWAKTGNVGDIGDIGKTIGETIGRY